MVTRIGPWGVWIVLIAATLISYVSWTDTGWAGPRGAGSTVVVIALGKAWLIGMRYMELDEAIWPLRLLYQLWILLVGAMLLTMFWLTP